jgi:nitrite reductase/ring-hydroxylating ferredoxin subunit
MVMIKHPDLVHFTSTATGSKRTFSLKLEDISLKKLALFAAVAPDLIELRVLEGAELVGLDQLTPGSTYVVEKKIVATRSNDWVVVCSVQEHDARCNKLGAVRVGVDGRDVMILRKDNSWFAFDAVCFHFGGPLMDGSVLGDIEDLQIVCPWHRYRIDLTTGKSVQSRAEVISEFALSVF